MSSLRPPARTLVFGFLPFWGISRIPAGSGGLAAQLGYALLFVKKKGIWGLAFDFAFRVVLDSRPRRLL